VTTMRRAAPEDHLREGGEDAGRLPAQRRQTGAEDEGGKGSARRGRARAQGREGGGVLLRVVARRGGGTAAAAAVVVLLAACCARPAGASPFQFMTRHNRCRPVPARRTRARLRKIGARAALRPLCYAIHAVTLVISAFSSLTPLVTPVSFPEICFVTHSTSSQAAATYIQHFEKKLQGQIAPNVTIVRQAWYSKDQKRWDDTAGGDIDGMVNQNDTFCYTLEPFNLCARAVACV
jgi:hypothetical protein